MAAQIVLDFDKLRKELGDGPMRFAPIGERTFDEQLADLTTKERECYNNLKQKWENNKKKKNKPFTDDMYLRFARCSPGTKKFNEKTAYSLMKKFDRKYLNITAKSLESQLLDKVLFPIPNLKTKDGHDVFYMRPSRYYPSNKKTPTKVVINNLAYCMNTMLEKELACKDGIGFLAYMNDWKMENFGIDYCYQFMHVLQGRVPARVRLFLIVNPPSWFGKIWSIMKIVLAEDFRKKVKMIQESELIDYLQDGYMELLPDDLESGIVNTKQMVEDYVVYRKFIEEKDDKKTYEEEGEEETETVQDDDDEDLSKPPNHDGDDDDDDEE